MVATYHGEHFANRTMDKLPKMLPCVAAACTGVANYILGVLAFRLLKKSVQTDHIHLGPRFEFLEEFLLKNVILEYKAQQVVARLKCRNRIGYGRCRESNLHAAVAEKKH